MQFFSTASDTVRNFFHENAVRKEIKELCERVVNYSSNHHRMSFWEKFFIWCCSLTIFLMLLIFLFSKLHCAQTGNGSWIKRISLCFDRVHISFWQVGSVQVSFWFKLFKIELAPNSFSYNFQVKELETLQFYPLNHRQRQQMLKLILVEWESQIVNILVAIMWTQILKM